jgi:hypothetical protein
LSVWQLFLFVIEKSVVEESVLSNCNYCLINFEGIGIGWISMVAFLKVVVKEVVVKKYCYMKKQGVEK